MVDEAVDHDNSVASSLWDILMDHPHSLPTALVEFGRDYADDGDDDDDNDNPASAAADPVALHSDCTYY